MQRFEQGPVVCHNSWGLTVPPKLVHREHQDSRFWSPGSSNRHAKTDTHCTHVHRDTPVHRGQGSGEMFRDDGREWGERHATAVPLTDCQSSQGSFRARRSLKAQPDGTDVSRAFQSGLPVADTLVGRVMRSILNWENPFPAGGQPWEVQWVLRVATRPTPHTDIGHPQDGVSVSL